MHRTRVCPTQAHVHQRVAKKFNLYLICQHHSLVYLYCAGGNKQLCSRGIELPQFNWWQYIRLKVWLTIHKKTVAWPTLPRNKRILKRVSIIKSIIVILTSNRDQSASLTLKICPSGYLSRNPLMVTHRGGFLGPNSSSSPSSMTQRSEYNATRRFCSIREHGESQVSSSCLFTSREFYGTAEPSSCES